ncbi:MAG: hypothetical protein R2689_07540 [Microthrixaceae bacterium]
MQPVVGEVPPDHGDNPRGNTGAEVDEAELPQPLRQQQRHHVQRTDAHE